MTAASLVAPHLLAALYLYGFCCASSIIWSRTPGGLLGLCLAVVWPVWLPFWAAKK